jgi:hypothetical protein
LRLQIHPYLLLAAHAGNPSGHSIRGGDLDAFILRCTQRRVPGAIERGWRGRGWRLFGSAS